MREFFETFSFLYDAKKPLIFNSKEFLVLFIVFYGLYILKRKSYYFRLIYVSLFSLYFYYKCSGNYFLLLIFSSVVDYYLALYIHNNQEKFKREWALLASMFINLGLLMYFKYTNFYIENINNLTGLNFSKLDIFLPIGISFYTFQTMSYTIDVYRRQLKPANNFLEFLFFVSFFPQLVAGPIVRASQFIPQIMKRPKLSEYKLDKALLLIMGGLIKKVVISDYISVNFVDRVFETPNAYSAFDNLLATYGYTIQIYCDFSGYSDMAIGLALLMGFTLPPNFRSPYQSKSITEFWRRWHISLSTWLRDYLYISLGGNRKGQIRTYINLFLVMFFGGLWHGASWKYVLWGMMHGTMLAIERFFKQYVRLPKFRYSNFIKWFLTLHFVMFCWIFFRASDYDTAVLVIKKITNIFSENVNIIHRMVQYKYIILLIIFGFTVHLTPNKYFFKGYRMFRNTRVVYKVLLLSFVMWLVYLFINSEVQPFIYFQF